MIAKTMTNTTSISLFIRRNRACLSTLSFLVVMMTCFLIVLGFLLYWTYGRKKAKREFALLHLIERITAREITSHHLET